MIRYSRSVLGCNLVWLYPQCLSRISSHCRFLVRVRRGFRVLRHSGAEGVRLISQNGNTFKSFLGRTSRDLKRSPCNHDYSQWLGREELFERERGSHPDCQIWDGCALLCEGAEVA